jgi:hypothetical protein
VRALLRLHHVEHRDRLDVGDVAVVDGVRGDHFEVKRRRLRIGVFVSLEYNVRGLRDTALTVVRWFGLEIGYPDR